MSEKTYRMEDLMDIVARLRGDGGCPWDRKQTIDSLRPYVVEEAYEVTDAAKEGGMHLADELGDLLLQVAMMAQIGQEQGDFTINDVLRLVCEKMVRRHPHVFGDVQADTAEEVLKNWDEIKKQERGQTKTSQLMQDVAQSLPALLYAEKVQKRAAKVGFDFDAVQPMLAKLREEVDELEEAVAAGDQQAVHMEFGDVLFAAVNVSRACKTNPEIALRDSSAKFIRRFCYMEDKIQQMGRNLEEMTMAELDAVWDEAKAKGL